MGKFLHWKMVFKKITDWIFIAPISSYVKTIIDCVDDYNFDPHVSGKKTEFF